jgi:hypothetical protein
MATLYKRATPTQARILRIVAGAVMNVAHYHPEYGLTDRIARSIAKRATGTLTAQWREVLAARTARGFVLSQSGKGLTCTKALRMPSHLLAAAGERHISQRRSPLHLIQHDLGILAGAARKAGDTARYEALADALRTIAKHTAPMTSGNGDRG